MVKIDSTMEDTITIVLWPLYCYPCTVKFHHRTVELSPSYCQVSPPYCRTITIVLSNYHHRTVEISPLYFRTITIVSNCSHRIVMNVLSPFYCQASPSYCTTIIIVLLNYHLSNNHHRTIQVSPPYCSNFTLELHHLTVILSPPDCRTASSALRSQGERDAPNGTPYRYARPYTSFNLITYSYTTCRSNKLIYDLAWKL